MTSKKSDGSESKKIQKAGIGLGLTAAATTMAGAYFLYGSKNATHNRKKVKSWALKAKADVLEGLEKAEEITEGEYAKLVETASGVYGTVKNASKGEVVDFKKEMLTHWNDLQKNPAVKKIVHPVVEHIISKQMQKKKTTPKKSKRVVKTKPNSKRKNVKKATTKK